jgi:two-component system sensor histidine kinase/response regulator
MNGVLVKPIDPALLSETLAKWLRTPGASEDPRPRDSGDHPDLLHRIAGMSGIAAYEGLKYTGGDVGRYLRSLRRFAETHGDDMDRLGELLAATQGPEAVRLVHSLKGVAAMLGARSIQERAAALETVLKVGLENPDIPGLTNDLRSELGDFVAALLSALPAEAAVAPAAADAAAARRQLQRLESYLAEDNVAATQFFREAEPQFHETLGERADLLRQMLDNFDYPVALELIRAILSEPETRAGNRD